MPFPYAHITRRPAGILIVALLMMGLAPRAAAVDYTWTGATNPLWSEAGNWSPAEVPNATDARVTIPNGATVTLDLDATLGDLTIDLNATLSIEAGRTLTVTGLLRNTAVLDGDGPIISGDGSILLDGGSIYLGDADLSSSTLDIQVAITGLGGAITGEHSFDRQLGGPLTLSSGELRPHSEYVGFNAGRVLRFANSVTLGAGVAVRLALNASEFNEHDSLRTENGVLDLNGAELVIDDIGFTPFTGLDQQMTIVISDGGIITGFFSDSEGNPITDGTVLSWTGFGGGPVYALVRYVGHGTAGGYISLIFLNAPPATITVTTTDDAGAGSLRQAVADAADWDTIVFDAALAGQTITLASEISIEKHLFISGPGADQLTISGGGSNRIFAIPWIDGDPHRWVDISGLGFSNGLSTGSGGAIWGIIGHLTIADCQFTGNEADLAGGAIAAVYGTLEVRDSAFHANTVTGTGLGYGGAISTDDTDALLVFNSTFADNNSHSNGGALYIKTMNPATIVNATITGNDSVFGLGGGLFVDPNRAMARVSNTILFANTLNGDGTAAGADADGAFDTMLSRNNLLGVTTGALELAEAPGAVVGLDPLLGPCQDNGGPTWTCALGEGSPAIDAGDDATATLANLTYDQRGLGFNRILGAAVDIGAYEALVGETSIVTFDSNGGTAPDPTSKSVIFDQPYGTLATTSRTGYTLTGWFTAPTGGSQITAATIVNIADDHTLYAQWALVTYPITYESPYHSGGTVPSSQVKTHGIDLTLATNSGNLVRSGYAFTGWNTAADGSGTAYAEGATYTTDAALTLYPDWSAILPVVTIAFADSHIAEPDGETVLTVSADPAPVGSPLVVDLNWSGTAVAADFEGFGAGLPTSISIPAGEESATITFTLVADDLIEGRETLTVSLVSSDTYIAGTPASATLTIDDDLHLLVVAPSPAAGETVSPGQSLALLIQGGQPPYTIAISGIEAATTTGPAQAWQRDIDSNGSLDSSQSLLLTPLAAGTMILTVSDDAESHRSLSWTVAGTGLSTPVDVAGLVPLSPPGRTIYGLIAPGSSQAFQNLLSWLSTRDGNQAKAFVWDAIAQTYRRLPDQAPANGLHPGLGVFLASRDAFEGDFQAEVARLPYAVLLRPGWNLVAIPPLLDGLDVRTEHNWSTLELRDEIGTLLGGTQRDDILGDGAYHWNGSAYELTTTLHSDRGYWIRNAAADDQPYYLFRMAGDTFTHGGFEATVAASTKAHPVAYLGPVPAPPGDTGSTESSSSGSCGSGGLTALGFLAGAFLLIGGGHGRSRREDEDA